MNVQTLTAAEIGELGRITGSASSNGTRGDRRVRAYDFRRPERLSGPKLGTLRRSLAGLTGAWSQRASRALRVSVSAEVLSIEEAPFDVYAESLPDNQVIALMRADRDGAHAYLDMPADLALSVANRMAGGRGEIHQWRSRLTHIETVIVKRFMAHFCEDLSEACSRIQPLRFTLADMAQSADDVKDVDDGLVVVGMNWVVGDHEYVVDLAMSPNLIGSFASEADDKTASHAPECKVDRRVVESKLGSVTVPVAADLGHARVTMHELMRMEVGDVIRLEHPIREPIAMTMGKHTVFHSHAGMVGDKLAVKIERGISEAGTQIAVDSLEITEE